MGDTILEKMKTGVYYPAKHLGTKKKIAVLEKDGYLQRMDGSFLCGPDSAPNYCLTEKGIHKKKNNKG